MDYRFAASPPAGRTETAQGSGPSERPASAEPEPASPPTSPLFDPGRTCADKDANDEHGQFRIEDPFGSNDYLGPPCWMEIENHPGCYTWNPALRPDETVTWSGECAGGLAHGTGSRKWRTWFGNVIGTGELRAGKPHGRWTMRAARPGESDYFEEGPFVDGKKHGHWIEREESGRERRLVRERQAKRSLDHPNRNIRGGAFRLLRGRREERSLDCAVQGRGWRNDVLREGHGCAVSVICRSRARRVCCSERTPVPFDVRLVSGECAHLPPPLSTEPPRRVRQPAPSSNGTTIPWSRQRPVSWMPEARRHWSSVRIVPGVT